MQPSLDDLLIDLESQKNANESEKSNRILTESIEKLKQENDSLIYGLAGAHDSKTAVKVEQAVCIAKHFSGMQVLDIYRISLQNPRQPKPVSERQQANTKISKKNTRRKRHSDVRLVKCVTFSGNNGGTKSMLMIVAMRCVNGAVG